jgi:Bacteriophage Lambda NinG protein
MSRCPICRAQYQKWSMTQKVCKNPACAEQYGREKARQLAEKQKRKEAKEDRLSIRERKEAIKKKSEVKKEVERVVNTYIRERDKDQPCISCGSYTSYPFFHAGHFISVGANDTLRFEPDNIHKQCCKCNTHGNGMYGPYRINLIKKIGIERVEWLEGPHNPKHYSKEDLQALKACFRNKLKDIKKGIS